MIDVNCDMGEGYGRWDLGADDELVGEITSANIACGFHAGDPRTMDRTVSFAAAAGVTVGAHVAYPDLVGFGRRHLAVSGEELVTDVLVQIGALDAICHRRGTAVGYVKAHGALYTDIVEDRGLCEAFADAILAYRSRLAVLALAGSPALEVLGARGVPVVAEAFADRAYTAEGRLVPRARAGAVIDDVDAVAERAWRIASGQPIESVDGASLTVRAASLCVHGDSPGAVTLARAVRRSLDEHGIEARAFA